MDARINKIHELLNEISSDLGSDDGQTFVRNFDALELPNIVSTVVRYLQPLLLPYEAAIYWHMFYLSILSTGQPYCRVSTRGLMTGVIKSSSGQSNILSLQTTRGALQGLSDKGAIIQTGEANREGTPYRVLLPEEIQPCVEAMHVVSLQDPVKHVDTKKELDYYNVAENRLRLFERDEYKCNYCGKQLTRFTATLDHIQPIAKGGDNSFDNLVTACLLCNSRRGAQPVMEAVIHGNSENP